jgi:hypothetical protein
VRDEPLRQTLDYSKDLMDAIYDVSFKVTFSFFYLLFVAKKRSPTKSEMWLLQVQVPDAERVAKKNLAQQLQI